MRLAVGMTRSASRKKVSPVSRCLTPTATVPWWAFARAVRRAARSASAGAGRVSNSRGTKGDMRLSSGGLFLVGAGEQVAQGELEAGEHVLPVQGAVLPHPAGLVRCVVDL